MRIDRRGNPAYRKIPVTGHPPGNADLTGNDMPQAGKPGMSADQPEARARDISPNPSNAFDELGNTDSGFLVGIVSMFTAVGRALKDIKQGNSKTFE